MSALPDAVTSDQAGTSPALVLSNIHAGYGRTMVLRDVSVGVPAGAVVALLGANGAGKTTTLRVAAGLLRAAQGTVSIFGHQVTRQPTHQRARQGICLVPEGRGIFRSLSVKENLQIQIPPWSDNHSLDKAIEAFPDLGARMQQVAGSLSGGQQQMLAMARAYLASPRVVLLDEVSMGLAPRIVDAIFESFRHLTANGVALLLVEQYVNRALEMADHAYLMTRGRISWSGPAADLDEDAVTQAYLGHGEPTDTALQTPQPTPNSPPPQTNTTHDPPPLPCSTPSNAQPAGRVVGIVGTGRPHDSHLLGLARPIPRANRPPVRAHTLTSRSNGWLHSSSRWWPLGARWCTGSMQTGFQSRTAPVGGDPSCLREKVLPLAEVRGAARRGAVPLDRCLAVASSLVEVRPN
jgi:branched-chain amino acid transport system ATP-binding protein